MSPIAVFVIILIVIWALSALGTMINKQQEAERRRKFRESTEHSQSPQRSSPPPINPAYSVRHPEMLAPSAPLRAARRPMGAPQQRLSQPRRPQPIAQKGPRAGRRSSAASVPPIPAFQAAEALPPPLRRPTRSMPPVQPVGAQAAPQTAGAPAIARWLRPDTLRHQFVLTEIFQPPLAMRQDRGA